MQNVGVLMVEEKLRERELAEESPLRSLPDALFAVLHIHAVVRLGVHTLAA